MGGESGGLGPKALLYTSGGSDTPRSPTARSGRATGARPRPSVRPRAPPPRACATRMSGGLAWAALAQTAGAAAPRGHRSSGATQANRSAQARHPQAQQEELDGRGAGCDTASLWLDGCGGSATTTAASCAAPVLHPSLAGVGALLQGSTGDRQAHWHFFFAHPMTHDREYRVGEEGQRHKPGPGPIRAYLILI